MYIGKALTLLLNNHQICTSKYSAIVIKPYVNITFMMILLFLQAVSSHHQSIMSDTTILLGLIMLGILVSGKVSLSSKEFG